MSKATTEAPADVSTSTVPDVDQDALTRAGEMLGTESPRDTVNEALREVVRRRQVRGYIELMKRIAEDQENAVDPRADAW
jgi:Arc/MetJ family transcription regulator